MYQSSLEPPAPKTSVSLGTEELNPSEDPRGPNVVHIMVQTDSTKRSVVGTFPKSHAMALGIAQLTCGILSILLGLISFRVVTVVAQVGHGIWGAILSLVAGSLGVAAAVRKTKALIVSHMVLSILNVCFVWGPIFTSIVGSTLDSSVCTEEYRDFYYSYQSLCYDWTDSMRYGPFVMDILLIVVGFIQFVVATWAASLSCRYVCCRCCMKCCCVCYPNPDLQRYKISSEPRVVAGYSVTNRQGQVSRGYGRLVEEMEPPNYDDVTARQNVDV